METHPRIAAHSVPRHVAIIMDGNGRWAEARGLSRVEGHREGARSVRDVTRAARRAGVEALTLYAFSAQNWARPALEVAALMELLRDYLVSERSEILDNGVRLHAIGDLGRLPLVVREPLDWLCRASARNRGMVLTLALSYGAREEIARAAQHLARLAAEGAIAPDDIGEEELSSCLWTSALPPVDLIIRTGGERRLSNFLLWQAAYAELCFTDTPWPEFRARELHAHLEEFGGRERRFGQTGAQVRDARVAS
jgi:undecaprenyl diphosphate synthase